MANSKIFSFCNFHLYRNNLKLNLLLKTDLRCIHSTIWNFGPIQDRIETKLRKELNPVKLQIDNESFMHNVPKNSETHFRVLIVSDQFENVNTLNRHQKVIQVLRDEFLNIHALTIEAYTSVQWELDYKNKSRNKSPRCLGGSKFENIIKTKN